ncbi:NAD(P)-dependent oxidoreductase [Corynebacterium sp. sy017]|uniref:NAD(P)H-binding protein n=1 Tax=unclassified Corynebacterium TaxID=2624378 RepID=UPI001184BAFE|nr:MULTISPECIES: NAD(P)H-binding protein [unclassified Corynebacterium]MBP3089365.1 NAD(P)-dependent oxidoreductase [Corynebacterium sp. sy017]TSD90941.1 NAD(P)-dependent oxidoreductase [Corynebacterium sp. SY003]
MNRNKKVLYIGGHGKIGLLATKKMTDTGINVHSLIRNPDYVGDIEALGAHAVLADITALTTEEWADLLTQYDDVVWGAGNGGRSGVDATWAVDRDGAMSTIDALEKLSAEGRPVPRYIMISYLGSMTNTAEESTGSWYAYVESKKAVDQRLTNTSLPHIILGPSTLSDAPATGITIYDADTAALPDSPLTSRELVADVVCEIITRKDFPQNNPLEFFDGELPVAKI